MPRPLSREEREQFLAGLHVGVVSIDDGDRGPLSRPVWYTYRPGGEVVFCTRKETRKAALLRRGMQIGFLVQVEGDMSQGILPCYVSVTGPVVKLEDADLDRDLRPIVHRYLGREIGDGYLQATRGERADDEIVVHLRPERWHTRNFAA
jgi:nitroimidazol reductase NimA-like FMN-containing flavoprotein (pyridoxamine 5'-phosphate oxidase superfamily)